MNRRLNIFGGGSLLVLALLLLCRPLATAQEATRLTYKDLQRIVSVVAEKNKKWGTLRGPHLEEGRQVVYYNLDVYTPPCPRDLSRVSFMFHFPIRNQHTVESIKRNRSYTEVKNVWLPYLDKIERLISDDVSLIQSCDENDEEGKYLVLRKLHAHNRAISDLLETAISEVSDNKVPVMKVDSKTNQTAYKVNFKLKPANGRLYYITLWEHRILERFNAARDFTKWNDGGVTGGAEIVGEFYFHAEWPSLQKIRDYGVVKVEKDTTLLFSPD